MCHRWPIRAHRMTLGLTPSDYATIEPATYRRGHSPGPVFRTDPRAGSGLGVAVGGVVEPGADHDRPELGLGLEAERCVKVLGVVGL